MKSPVTLMRYRAFILLVFAAVRGSYDPAHSEALLQLLQFPFKNRL